MLMPLRTMAHHLQVGRDAPEVRRLRDAYLEAFSDLAPPAELIATLELACHVGKVIRAMSWLSLTGDHGSGSGRRRKQAMQWLNLLLHDSYIGID
jgi:hypothetical protein